MVNGLVNGLVTDSRIGLLVEAAFEGVEAEAGEGDEEPGKEDGPADGAFGALAADDLDYGIKGSEQVDDADEREEGGDAARGLHVIFSIVLMPRQSNR